MRSRASLFPKHYIPHKFNKKQDPPSQKVGLTVSDPKLWCWKVGLVGARAGIVTAGSRYYEPAAGSRYYEPGRLEAVTINLLPPHPAHQVLEREEDLLPF